MKFLIAALVLICGSVSAQTYQAGDLTLTDAFSYPTTGRSGAGYFTLTNDGAADALLDVEADYPKVMLHKSMMKDGVMTMEHQMRVVVPPQGEIEFAPGGYHVMFMGLKEGWGVGDDIKATLIFEKSGSLEVTFKVIERP
ncbi:MAG: copper chaperone PCu(A)C [Rhodobacteraceae bacterium]|jgi:copper(I)-binding protein|uniref:copper chaperone PCu(A)C n=1 Tax=uncultured Planktomarina sp. TaxID=1538529 RepID=UPI002A078220|nr:copper chaperone PCu(A)C [Paracoccaceae bacterium]MBT6521475.1 copper chaperone PCu(A)C [Paracoccaceae bacterium]MBT7344389.1 copper chaperone PCu(A)C [Paracoccaceae bacterium]